MEREGGGTSSRSAESQRVPESTNGVRLYLHVLGHSWGRRRVSQLAVPELVDGLGEGGSMTSAVARLPPYCASSCKPTLGSSSTPPLLLLYASIPCRLPLAPTKRPPGRHSRHAL